MGGGGSKERKASVKSDAVQDEMAKLRDDASASKQDVRSSVEAHQGRRSRSVASLGGSLGRFQSGAQDAVNIADDADGWGENVAYGVGAGRHARLMSNATVHGVQAVAPDAEPSPQNSARRPQVFEPSPRNQDLEQEDWGELNETNGTRRRDLASLRQRNPSAGASSHGSLDEDRAYQEMLNEAIIQSVLEQSKAEGAELALPSQHEEDQMLKEVLKMSALEYDKASGKVGNLDFLKKNKKPKKKKLEDETGQNLIMGNMTDA